MPRYVQVANRSLVPENTAVAVQAEGRNLVLVNLNGQFYALDDYCPHEGAPLSDGEIAGDEIVCPWHSSHFDIRTGRVTMDPAESDIATYKVRVVGDALEVEIES
jgi:3-phenylpropionate/trans-cinnamate dioxygenase ferredoxin subunit